jgi:peptide deformylase
MEDIFMKLELIKHPSDWLSRKLDPWDFDNPPMDPVDMKKQMLKIMKANLGIGLSANQVGINARAFVFVNNNTTNNQIDRESLCLNPEVVEKLGEDVPMWEGCLSFPEVVVQVTRNHKIKAKWYTEHGKLKEDIFVGYDAVCFQHEIDHLDGITFDQHVSPMAWKEAVEKAKKKLDNA